MTKRPTIADVARVAGVSLTTVSHALNGKGRIDNETRRRIQQISNRLGYVPNRNARNLALGGKSDTIGLLLPQLGRLPLDELLSTDWYGRTALWASQHAMRHGRAITILPGLPDAKAIARLGLEGMILLDPLGDDPRIRLLDEVGISYVLVGQDLRRPQLPWVGPDTPAAITVLLDHLSSKGARSIALLATDIEWSATSETIGAYEEWCRNNTAPKKVATVRVAECRTRQEIRDRTHQAAVRLLQSRSRPEAIIGLLDEFGRAVIKAAHDLGLKVPDDLLVAQDVDSIHAQMTTPAITAIDLNPDALMAQAIHQLLGIAPPGQHSVSTTLQIRKSTCRNNQLSAAQAQDHLPNTLPIDESAPRDESS